MPSRSNLKKAYQIFLHLTLVILAIEVIVLSLENRELRKGQQATAKYHLSPGDTISLGSIESLTGKSRIDTASHQLVFLFTTKCPFCKLIMPNWKALTEFALKQKISVVGVSLDLRDSTAKFVEKGEVPFPVFVARDPAQFKKLNRISSVPQTLILTPESRVAEVWEGLLSEKASLEIRGYLASLPTNH